MLTKAWLALLAAIPLAATGVEDKEIAKCAAINSSIERLQCFDGISESLGLTNGKKVTTSKPGKNWSMRVDKSPIDDSRKVVLHTDALEPVWFSSYRRIRPSLVLRCQRNRTTLFITYENFIGTDTTQVTVRFDKAKARKETWDISTSHRSIFARRPITHIKRILKASKLIVSVVPYGENPVLAEFDISGAEAGVKQIRKACNW